MALKKLQKTYMSYSGYYKTETLVIDPDEIASMVPCDNKNRSKITLKCGKDFSALFTISEIEEGFNLNIETIVV